MLAFSSSNPDLRRVFLTLLSATSIESRESLPSNRLILTVSVGAGMTPFSLPYPIHNLGSVVFRGYQTSGSLLFQLLDQQPEFISTLSCLLHLSQLLPELFSVFNFVVDCKVLQN